jgi:hypothetical protein
MMQAINHLHSAIRNEVTQDTVVIANYHQSKIMDVKLREIIQTNFKSDIPPGFSKTIKTTDGFTLKWTSFQISTKIIKWKN